MAEGRGFTPYCAKFFRCTDYNKGVITVNRQSLLHCLYQTPGGVNTNCKGEEKDHNSLSVSEAIKHNQRLRVNSQCLSTHG